MVLPPGQAVASTFEASTKNSFGMEGWLVHLVVHGQRHSYDKVKRRPELERIDPDEDWRQVFLDAEPGRIINWKGNLYMKANGTEVKGFLIRDDKLKVDWRRSPPEQGHNSGVGWGG